MGALEGWGFEVNIYDVPDLEPFLKAALLLPTSLTADFNFRMRPEIRERSIRAESEVALYNVAGPSDPGAA